MRKAPPNTSADAAESGGACAVREQLLPLQMFLNVELQRAGELLGGSVRCVGVVASEQLLKPDRREVQVAAESG